jgi:phage baseplate assembly protein gpV
MVRTEVERVLRIQMSPRLGNVMAYDPKLHAVQVALQPEGLTTNWIPLSSPSIGNGWGMVAIPSIGDQVKVNFPEYGATQGVTVARVYDERNAVPMAAQNGQPGEFFLVDKMGSTIALTTDGHLRLNGNIEVDVIGPGVVINAASAAVTINGSTAINLTAPNATITAARAVTIMTPMATVSNGGSVLPVKRSDGSNSTTTFVQ